MYRIDVELFLDQLSRESNLDDFFEEELDLSCLKRSTPHIPAPHPVPAKKSQEMSCA